jgi:hypothetical protein
MRHTWCWAEYLWESYSHVTQTVSELTADGAPDAALLAAMEFASLVGYGLFPLRDGTEINPENLGHLVVTGVAVVCTIGSVICVGIGLMKTPALGRRAYSRSCARR